MKWADLWIQTVPRTDDDRRRLIADIGPKVIAEDAIGYETLLESDPTNVRLQDAVAAIDLSLHRPEQAVVHELDALRINPNFVLSHYNLAWRWCR
jgi:hypothetical protein